jgi:hypothetical protein
MAKRTLFGWLLIGAVVWTLIGIGCAALRDAFTDDRSAWTPQMHRDVAECEREVVEGRWRWGEPPLFRHSGQMRFPVSFSDARRACLRERGWRL